MASFRNLGQQTGKVSPGAQNPALINTPECLDLIRMMGEPRYALESNLSPRDYTFYCDMHAKAKQYGGGLVVTGRQLFWLRDIKDRLVERGVV